MNSIVSDVNDVRYNPATCSFEGLVTFETQEGPTKVAAEYPAPLDTEHDAAVEGVRSAAIDSLNRPNALKSQVRTRLAGSHPSERGGLFPLRDIFGNLFGNRAA